MKNGENNEIRNISHRKEDSRNRTESKKRRLIPTILVVIVTCGLFSFPVYSQTRFDFSGMVKLFLSIYASKNQEGPYFFHDSGDFAFKRLESRILLNAAVSDNVSARLRLDAFSSPDALFSDRNFPEAGVLAAPDESEPFELSLYEAYVKVNHFLLRDLDLTVGKQRIQWGTADKLNVVDNLNPVDFANFLTFDPDYYLERRPQTALNFEFYPLKNTKLQLVWLVNRQLSPLPAGFSEMLKANHSALAEPEINIATEKTALKNTNLGLRLSTVLLNIDLGLSYHLGNYSLPYIQGVETNDPLEQRPSQVYFKYPKKQVFGLDLSGELESIGWWAELARIQPESVSAWLRTYVLIGGQTVPVSLDFQLMEKSYWQWVIGADYTFSVASGFYINLQYLHGLFDEASFSSQSKTYFGLRKGMWFGQLQDYLAGKAELRFLKGDLKVAVNSMVELSSGNSSAIFYPSLEYKIHDAVFLQAGAILATGDRAASKFGSFSRDKVIYLMTKLNF